MGGGGRFFMSDRFQGSNRFWFGDRCITGPHLRGLLFTAILILITVGLALGITFPWLLRHHAAIGAPLVSVFVLLVLLSMASGWLTGTTDPGIIPRSPSPPADMLRNPSRPRERRLVLHGRTVVVKYCETCRIWRPPHTSHCSTCNNCVDRFDHHCPYCSGCIGRRNYRSFITFVSSTALLSLLALASAILHLVLKTRFYQDKNDSGISQALRDTLSDGPTAVNFVVIFICMFGFSFTGGLTGFHLYLMWHNVTTAESFKKSVRNSSCDADDLRGLRAIWYIMTRKRPPSRITADYDGLRYPDEAAILDLIERQDEDDQVAQMSVGAPRPSIVGGRVPPASARVAKYSADQVTGKGDDIV